MAINFGKLRNTAPSHSLDEAGMSKLLQQTYMLLSITLGVTAIVALISQQLGWPAPGILISLVGFYGLMFLIHKTQDSGKSIFFTLMLAAFMGYTLGPILNKVLNLQNGGTLIANAFLMTAFAFVALSAYVTRTGKDMSFLGGFLVAGFVVLLVGVVLSMIFNISGLGLALSVGFVLFSCAAILFETSAIIHGGQTNYVLATVGLYVSIYNLFLSLLNLLQAFSGNK
ncbi:Bax inhibitor-1 family protein [Pseudomonas serbica]|jgi:modulator of FtsH protease|uniref:Bax inhibitor-1 family protein n=1 Tax=Pseudomonas serbica TaxID=2965074 RepID=UPI00237B3436|nr:Bax inhibitor-1 family protein [Pseudomonas serbica]